MFDPDPFRHAICSYKYKDIPVDIMSSEDGPLGPENRWYQFGFNDLKIIKINETEIHIFSAPCYLATKFEAFNSRGKDYRTSHDFEDIIYVLDNRAEIVDEMELTQKEVREFVKTELIKVLNNPHQEEIISAHIHPVTAEERYPLILEKINRVVK